MAEPNKALLRRHFGELWSQGNVALVDELFASDCLVHVHPDEIEGREAIKHYVSTVRGGFPDLQVWATDLIAEGDQVATRWMARTMQTGQIPDIIGNRPMCVIGISICRIADGKVVECWTLYSKGE